MTQNGKQLATGEHLTSAMSTNTYTKKQVVARLSSNSHYGKSGGIMVKMKFETIEHEREKMLPAIKINITS